MFPDIVMFSPPPVLQDFPLFSETGHHPISPDAGILFPYLLFFPGLFSTRSSRFKGFLIAAFLNFLSSEPHSQNDTFQDFQDNSPSGPFLAAFHGTSPFLKFFSDVPPRRLESSAVFFGPLEKVSFLAFFDVFFPIFHFS